MGGGASDVCTIAVVQRTKVTAGQAVRNSTRMPKAYEFALFCLRCGYLAPRGLHVCAVMGQLSIRFCGVRS